MSRPDQDDVEYAENFGLIKRTSDGLYNFANPIYNEVVPRILTQDTYLKFILSGKRIKL